MLLPLPSHPNPFLLCLYLLCLRVLLHYSRHMERNPHPHIFFHHSLFPPLHSNSDLRPGSHDGRSYRPHSGIRARQEEEQVGLCDTFREVLETEELPFVCRLCKTHVLERTKHCGTCNRCVEGFDHHCIWINNCVGRKNYRLFLFLILFVGVFCLLQLASSSIALATLHTRSHLLADFYNASELKMEILSYILLTICALTQIALTVFILQLGFLHCWLIKHDLTTYDYVIYIRKKKKYPNTKLRIEGVRKNYKSNVIQETDKSEFKEQKSSNNIDPSAVVKETRLSIEKEESICCTYTQI
eukprot:TRINITY_DN11794_c0_g1_i2.p1 TRINITY_DN11794_c0_g1~~TRINITY_DN11794_c0_g1_i2.p1  ORF type:complete len:300 (-),score=1.37 TRINITY_DN11794_c0_g1_i2:642-1541(-)